MPTVACEATDRDKHTTVAKFDTDSGPVGIDNRCSACISGYIQDFETPLVPTNRTIEGFGGSTTTGVMVGTIKWKVFDKRRQSTHISNPQLVLRSGMRYATVQPTTLDPKHAGQSETPRCRVHNQPSRHTPQLGGQEEEHVGTTQQVHQRLDLSSCTRAH